MYRYLKSSILFLCLLMAAFFVLSSVNSETLAKTTELVPVAETAEVAVQQEYSTVEEFQRSEERV